MSPNSGPDDAPQQPSRETALLGSLLSGGLGSQRGREAKFEHQFAEAFGSLDELKRQVISRLFGLDGQDIQSHQEIAAVMSAALTPELKVQLSLERGVLDGEISITSKDVKDIEVAAIRELRTPRTTKK